MECTRGMGSTSYEVSDGSWGPAATILFQSVDIGPHAFVAPQALVLSSNKGHLDRVLLL